MAIIECPTFHCPDRTWSHAEVRELGQTAVLVMCDALLVERFEDAAPTVTLDELSRAAQQSFSPVEVSADTPAYAHYTSDTTGPPKAVLHRHSDPAGYHAAMAGDVLELRADDALYSVWKVYFGYGFGNTIGFAPVRGAELLCGIGLPGKRRLIPLCPRRDVRG